MKWFFKRKKDNVDVSKVIDNIIKKQEEIEKLSNEELLNLDDKNVDINYNFSFHKAIDLLSGKEISIDGNISIEPYGALIISKDNSI